MVIYVRCFEFVIVHLGVYDVDTYSFRLSEHVHYT